MVKAYIKEQTILPEGVYPATVKKIEEVDNKFYNPEEDEDYNKQRLLVHFEVEHGLKDFKVPKFTMSRYMTPVISPMSTLYSLIYAIKGEKPELKDKDVFVDLSWLLDKDLQVVVKHKKTEDGQSWPRITDFLSKNPSLTEVEDSLPVEDAPF